VLAITLSLHRLSPPLSSSHPGLSHSLFSLSPCVRCSSFLLLRTLSHVLPNIVHFLYCSSVPFCSFFHTCLAIVLAIAPALHRAPHPQSSFLPKAVWLISLPLFAVVLVPKAVQSPPILLSTHSPPCSSSPEHLACYCTHSLARATSPKQFPPQGSVVAIPPALRRGPCPQSIVVATNPTLHPLSAVFVIPRASCLLLYSLFGARHIPEAVSSARQCGCYPSRSSPWSLSPKHCSRHQSFSPLTLRRARHPQSILLAIALTPWRAPHPRSSFTTKVVWLLSLPRFTVLHIPNAVYSPCIPLFTVVVFPRASFYCTCSLFTVRHIPKNAVSPFLSLVLVLFEVVVALFL
jgi:hypothetical protein